MRIFLGTPITSILEQKDKNICNKDLNDIKRIFNSLNSIEGWDTFCALSREKWGEEPMEGEICTELDYNEMKDCDVYITFPIRSHGVSVELGWGSAMNKKIIILFNEEYQILSPLHVGLHKLTDVSILSYKSKNKFPEENEWENNILPEIRRLIVDDELEMRKEVG